MRENWIARKEKKHPVRSTLTFLFCYRFQFREIMKWKWNYLERNPWEYARYRECIKRSQLNPHSFAFKKQFRTQMDDEFDINMNLIKKRLLEKELEKENDKEDGDSGIHETSATKLPSIPITNNPVKFLINYDNEVERAANQLNARFKVYKDFPKCYPELEREKEIFTRYLSVVKSEKNYDKETIESEFVKYWKLRIKTLYKIELGKKKEEIRKKWEDFTPKAAGFEEDMNTLLISDDEDDDDCIMIETA